jgi:RND family efflux transporter MFP subunit
MKVIILFFSGFISLYAQMEARAIIYSLDKTIISSEIAGKVLYLPKGEGEYFSKGKILAKIDCAIYKAQKRKMNIQQEIAYLQMRKNEELESLHSIGRFEVLISKEKLKKQKAELDIVSVNVKRCNIYAPFNGKVISKKVNMHQIVKPQQELLEIIGIQNLEARVVIPAIWLTKIKKGDKFNLAIDETGKTIKAKVKEIGAVVDSNSQTISLRAQLLKPYKNIIAGMSGTAYFTKR